jgi:predicted ATPase
MSDGTLRALAILVALFQKTERYPLDIVALEEPESGLHPAAAGVLFDSLVEGSLFRQVIVTSHSPDLLDREDIPEHALKAVVMEQGQTLIGEADEMGKQAMKDRLYTAGELMRMDQLRPQGLTA